MRPVARIAQSVEQGIENPRVLGSIPSPGTTLIKVRWLGLENLNGRYVEPGRTIDVAGQSTHRDGF